MTSRTFSRWQSRMRREGAALRADLPAVVRYLGEELQPDGGRGWRVPGNGGLIIWQGDDELWRWSHFSVGQGGDAISYLTEFHDMTREDAVELLIQYSEDDWDSPGAERDRRAVRSTPRTANIRRTSSPSSEWRERGSGLVRDAEGDLWRNPELDVWDWLHGRGLRDETIRNARLGWIPEDAWCSRTWWGLEED